MNSFRFLNYLRSDPGNDGESSDIRKHDAKYHGGVFDPASQSCSLRDALGRHDDEDELFTLRGGNDTIPSNVKKRDNASQGHAEIRRRRGVFAGAFHRPRLAYRAADILAENGDSERGTTLENGGQISPETVKGFFESVNSNEESARLFDLVYPAAERLGVEFYIDNAPFFSTELGNHIGGRVTYHMNKLTSPLESDEGAARAILHELIHGVTAYAIQMVDDGLEIDGTELNERLADAVERLDEVYRGNKAWILGQYGRKDIYEFIAELANPSFRSALKKRGVFRRTCEGIADVIRKIVGKSQKDRSPDYDKTVEILKDFIDNRDADTFGEYQHVGHLEEEK